MDKVSDGLVFVYLRGEKLSMVTCLRWAGDDWMGC